MIGRPTIEIQALDFANTLRNPKYNMGFRSRQETTTGAKLDNMLLPLNAMSGSHHDIDTVMLEVKHAYIIDKSWPDNYIHIAAAGKLNIEHLSVWMLRFDRRSPCTRIWRLSWWQVRSVLSTLSKLECREISFETLN